MTEVKGLIATVSLLGVVAVIAVGVSVSGANQYTTFNSNYSKSGLPRCESTKAEDALKQVMEDGISGKLGTRVLFVEDKKTISTSEKETKCTATLFLNQGGNPRVSYTFTSRGDYKWLMQMAPIVD